MQGEVEIARAQEQLATIAQMESEDPSAFARRLQKLHDLLDRLGEPVAPTKQATRRW